MQKMLVSIPEQLAARLRSAIPARKRSRVIAELIEREIERRERKLYDCAVEVEQDEVLHKEMAEWEAKTGQDGLEDESW